MATFLHRGAMGFIDSTNVWVRSYPVNAELFQAWHCLFTGSDKLVEAAFQIPILFGGLAAFGVLRTLGASQRASLAGSALFLFTPVVLLQGGNAYNDAWTAALFFMGCFLALQVRRHGVGNPDGRILTLLIAACAGILAGTKYLGLLWGGILIFLLCVLAWRTARTDKATRISARIAVSNALAAFAILVFFASYPYARNWIHTENPLAPAEVKAFGMVIFPGRPANEFLTIGSEQLLESGPWQTWLLPLWMDLQTTLFDPNNSGVGPLWFALGFLALPAGWFGAETHRFERRLLLALIVAGVLITPTNWRPRYDLALLLACGLGVAMVFDTAGKWQRTMLAGLIIVSAGYAVWALSIPMPVKPAQASALIRQATDLDRSAAFLTRSNEFYLWIQEQTRNEPASIVYGDHMDSCPPFGSDFRNKIIHVTPESADEWVTALDSEHVRFAIVWKDSPEEAWTLQTGVFIPAFEQDGLVAYERK